MDECIERGIPSTQNSERLHTIITINERWTLTNSNY